MDKLLTVQSLTIARGDAILAKNLSLEVAAGRAHLLVGANGAGKTSFLRSVAGLLPPQTGNITAASSHFIGATPLASSLETPRQYLNYQAALMGVPFHIMADVFGIEGVLDTALNRLSTGWRARVKLTRLMLSDRPLWLLDEPSHGLDAQALTALQKLVSTHIQNGGAAVIATHDPQHWPDAQIQNFGDVT